MNKRSYPGGIPHLNTTIIELRTQVLSLCNPLRQVTPSRSGYFKVAKSGTRCSSNNRSMFTKEAIKYFNGQERLRMSNQKDTGEKSDESTQVSASFTCEQCGRTFNSRQELKEHTH